jgi:hypothetical protein
MRCVLLKTSIAMSVALCCSVLFAQRVGIGGGGGAGAGAGANVGAGGAGANVGASANVGGAAGANVNGPRGGNVQVQPGPAGGANVNVQGPRGGNVNVQPGPGRANIDARANTGARTDFGRSDRGVVDRGGDRDRWRYRWDGGRWWYWLPGNSWSYYNDGNWVDYAPNYGGADSNYRWYNGNWWYWTNNGWLVYQNGQWIAPGTGSSYSDYDNSDYYYGGGYNSGYPVRAYGYYGGYPYRYWSGYRGYEGGRDFDRGYSSRGGAGARVEVGPGGAGISIGGRSEGRGRR